MGFSKRLSQNLSRRVILPLLRKQNRNLSVSSDCCDLNLFYHIKFIQCKLQESLIGIPGQVIINIETLFTIFLVVVPYCTLESFFLKLRDTPEYFLFSTLLLTQNLLLVLNRPIYHLS